MVTFFLGPRVNRWVIMISRLIWDQYGESLRLLQLVDMMVAWMLTHTIHVWYIYLFTYIGHKSQANVGKYNIHGSHELRIIPFNL